MTVTPVTLVNGVNTDGASNSISEVRQLSSTSALTLGSVTYSGTSATITWSVPDSATLGYGTLAGTNEYLVETSTSSAIWNSAGYVNTETVTLTNLPTGVTTYVRVRANINEIGLGAPAAVALNPVGVPAKPTGLFATVSSGSATLRWNAPTVLNGSTIVAYAIKRDGSVSETTTSSTLTQTGLTDNQSYIYSVAACTDSACTSVGAYSDTITVTPVGVLTAPTLTLTPSNASINVSITAVTGATSYSIETSTSGSSWSMFNAAASATSYSITGLANGQPILVRVTPFNSLGAGSATVATATPRTVPAVTHGRIRVTGLGSSRPNTNIKTTK